MSPRGDLISFVIAPDDTISNWLSLFFPFHPQLTTRRQMETANIAKTHQHAILVWMTDDYLHLDALLRRAA